MQQIDPVTSVVGDPIAVGDSPTNLVWDGTNLWVANAGDDTVQPIRAGLANLIWQARRAVQDASSLESTPTP